MSIKIALAGNPNCGKTTMFNSLTGSTQYVGNWPGVTVEKKEGKLKGHRDVIITDLPGIYSLSPYTLEEVVSRNYLLNEEPDAIINIIDGTNLERNLYLTTQVLELGIPVVVALNMMDLVNKNGDKIDAAKLSKTLGCEVVETSALKNTGILEAAKKAMALSGKKSKTPPILFSEEVEAALSGISSVARSRIKSENARWYAIKIFERDEKVMEELGLSAGDAEKIERIISALEDEMDDDSESIITNERYEWIGGMIRTCSTRRKRALTVSDQIDRVVTNRWLALPIFIVVMSLVYIISVTTIGAVVTDFTNDTLFGEWIQPSISGWLESVGAAGWISSLVVDGIIGGVGSVLGFVPQMLVLFLFLSLLEDCGYMARVAFIMDRIFRKFGLSGKSFIPMLVSSGCGVPGIMASKTIENEKDRRMTIITTTFIPCGAKLPVIALVMGAAFGMGMENWWVTPMFYFLGVAAVIISGVILKKTRMFAGDPAPFVMELPQYHMPTAKGVLIHVWERARSFIVKAGTVIFVSCALIWFLSNFGWNGGAFGYLGGDGMDGSILAVIGNAIAWIFAPLGFGYWQTAISSVMGLVAKENIISTFGVLFGLGEAGENDPGLWNSFGALLPAAFQQIAFLAFNLLCAPCVAAIGAIRREMASGKWTAFAIAYQCGLAYAVALLINQFGLLLADGRITVGTFFAVLVLASILYLLFRPDPDHKKRLQKAASSNL